MEKQKKRDLKSFLVVFLDSTSYGRGRRVTIKYGDIRKSNRLIQCTIYQIVIPACGLEKRYGDDGHIWVTPSCDKWRLETIFPLSVPRDHDLNKATWTSKD